MKFYFRPLAVALVVLAAATSTFDRARAQFSADQKGEIEKIIRDYLLRNPEILQEVIQEMERRQAQADLASATAAFMRGDQSTARQIAARAKTRFPIGSPGWVKADDLIGSKPSNTRN